MSGAIDKAKRDRYTTRINQFLETSALPKLNKRQVRALANRMCKVKGDDIVDRDLEVLTRLYCREK